ncbi:orotate phosphoribosyltransferase [Salisaeta longa]|uniref:orotate phosphoribosyltransferase n=1 Tax=Salisaeta longa TaxID=503170 RepID=UPI0003B48E53|nr:orotate phosphoribosyltransferase [Salisaeta longa]
MASATASTLARHLLTIDAVALRPNDPFTWSSGRRAPIYCDNRRTLAYPDVRRFICDAFVDVLAPYDLPGATVAGTATAGIPHAAWLADRRDAPMAYVRGAAKQHGRQNQIEGVVQPGDDVVLVEDLISTGGSALDAVQALRDAGATVHAVLAIFSYELDVAHRAFRSADVPLHVLTGYSTLLEVAQATGAIATTDLETLRTWRRDPEAWSRQFS